MSGARRAGDGTRWKPVVVRIPVDLLEHIDRASAAAYRTRTAELTMRLRASIAGESFDDHGVIVRHSASPRKQVGEPGEGGQ